MDINIIQRIRIDVEPIYEHDLFRLRFRVTTNIDDVMCYDKVFGRNDFKSFFRFMAEEGIRKIEQEMFQKAKTSPASGREEGKDK